MRLLLLVAVVSFAAAAFVFVVPSGATVHEIVAQWCSGQAELEPAGISDPAKKNFARPLVASGIATMVEDGAGPGTVLIQFDFDHPAIKIVPLGFNVNLGGPVWINAWTTDDDFPAFRNCPGYVGGGVG
jgi:hypothetical protein